MVVDEFKKMYNNRVIEINGCSTMDMFKESKYELPSTVSLLKSNLNYKSSDFSLYSDFMSFFKENNYRISSTPAEIIKLNFIGNEEINENDAYRYFLEMKYNLCVSDRVLELLQQCYSQDLLEEITNWFRNIEDSELLEILMYYDTVLKYPRVLKYFSLEPNHTRLLIDLMLDNTLNVDELCSYVNDKKLYDKFLLKSLDDTETKNSLDDSMLINRGDFSEVNTILRNLSDYPEDIMHKYADSKYLKQILLAYQKGIYYEDFIDLYCVNSQIEESILDLIMNEYAFGNFDKYFISITKGNFYLTKLLSDLQFLKISTDKVTLFLQNTEKLNLIHAFAVKVINAKLKNDIDELDYFKYISLICSNSDLKYLNLFTLINSTDVLSFNSFCFNILFDKIYNNTQKFEIPNQIGPFLCVISRNNTFSTFTTMDILLNIDRVVDIIDSSLLGATLQQLLMDNNGGIFILQKDKTIKSTSLGYLNKCSSSFDNYFITYTKEDYTNYNSETALFNSNFIIMKNRLAIHEDFENYIAKNQSMLLKYDCLLFRLNNDLIQFANLVGSKNFKVYMSCLNSLQVFNSKPVIFYQFINKIILSFYKGDYQNSDFCINELSENFTIDVLGISGFLNIDIKTFIDNIDRILGKITTLNSVRLVVDKVNDKIILKGWS